MSDETEKLIEEADSDLDALVDVIEAGKGRCEVPHDVALAVEPRCPACSYDCMELPTLIENGRWFCQRRTHVYMVVAQDWLGAIVEVREERQRKRQGAREKAEYATALRRAETDRDAALKQSAAWEIQAQDMRDRLIKAEAERDAQHEQVLRLTAERDAAKADAVRMLTAASQQAITSARLAADLDESRAQVWGLGCLVTNLRRSLSRQRAEHYEMRCRISDVDSLRYEVMGLRGRAYSHHEALCKMLAKVKVLESTRDLLTEENARLQERVATLELLLRGGK